jgi:PTH2 family peptidyl-tRNA hydrolase
MTLVLFPQRGACMHADITSQSILCSETITRAPGAGAAGVRDAVADVKQVIVIRRDLGMRRGKEIAQGAHASIAWLTERCTQKVCAEGYGDNWGINFIGRFTHAEWQWVEGNVRKVTLQVSSEEELFRIYEAAREAGLEVHLITDSGLTEFSGIPTATCLAIGPDFDEKINPVTSDLILY